MLHSTEPSQARAKAGTPFAEQEARLAQALQQDLRELGRDLPGRGLGVGQTGAGWSWDASLPGVWGEGEPRKGPQ